jgi:hypothetical protein
MPPTITRIILITRSCILSGGSRFYLLLLAVLCHEALVADVGEEEALVDGDVGGVHVGGGVGGALAGVPLLANMGITTLLLVVLLLLLLPPLVIALVTVTRKTSDLRRTLTISWSSHLVLPRLHTWFTKVFRRLYMAYGSSPWLSIKRPSPPRSFPSW